MQAHVEFVVGAEKRIGEIIARAEIEPLLGSLIKAGLVHASVVDDLERVLCRQGCGDCSGDCCKVRHDLLVEGEAKGWLECCLPKECDGAAPLARLARDAIQLIINNNLKRMFTTEVHTAIVQESYEQLVATNRMLAESEKRYRDLSCSLEQQVEERTAELKQAYARMLQQEKLAAVGTLAAGMAHEINNPNGFVRSNLVTFGRYVERFREMLDYYQELTAANTPLQQLSTLAGQRRHELKLDFVLSDSIDLLRQSLEGSDRIARIVADMKAFSHVDDTGEIEADLNIELERTLAVLEPRMAGVAVERDLVPLPRFRCHPGMISQALYNILLNALQSRNEGLSLVIRSRCENNSIRISIADNGCGIPSDLLPRVFDPFFTTRDVGGGTGMGLTVSREIIAAVGGTVELTSQVGSGTTAGITLPLTGRGRA